MTARALQDMAAGGTRRVKVTGPSLTRATRMWAPYSPVATGACSARARATR